MSTFQAMGKRKKVKQMGLSPVVISKKLPRSPWDCWD
jgi:hypothetical protein